MNFQSLLLKVLFLMV